MWWCFFFFLHRISPIYSLKYIIFFKIATLVWNECRAKLSFSSDSPNHSSSRFSGVSRMGTISGISSPCLIYQETCHEIHLACKSDLKRRRRTMTRLPAVSQSLYRNTLQKKIPACLRWNRCQICLKDMDQRALPTQTAHIKTAPSWIAHFPTEAKYLLLCGCCIKYVF